MAESAALLVDEEVFPEQPVRQWVLSFPHPLRWLFASRPAILGRVLGIVYRCIASDLIKKAGFSAKAVPTGAVTLIQRAGSALNLNIHFHRLFLDGVYVERADGSMRFRWVKAPTSVELTQLSHRIARRVGRSDARPLRAHCMRPNSLLANLSGATGTARGRCRGQPFGRGRRGRGSDGSALGPLDPLPHCRRTAGGA